MRVLEERVVKFSIAEPTSYGGKELWGKEKVNRRSQKSKNNEFKNI